MHRLRPTPALIVAGIALVMAMTGGAYAAGHLINGRQIKKHTIAANKLTAKARHQLKGRRGRRGRRGHVGATGPQGPQGLPGAKGATGAPGAKGAVGPMGPQGLRGATGATGPQGPKGDKGDAGATGPQGATGAKGDQGPKGDIGTPGTPGAPGVNGKSVVIETGASSCGEAGGITVSVEGDSSSAKEVCNGTDGTDGTDGTNGTNGTDGTNGVSGYEVVGRGADSATVAAGATQEVTTPCDSHGEVAIGGGARAISGTVTVNGSYPGEITNTVPPEGEGGEDPSGRWSATGWTVEVTNDGSAPATVQPYVICAQMAEGAVAP